jgi:toxin ParE1/3/4
MKLRISVAAEGDMEQTVGYIAAENPAAARKWLVEMRRRFDGLAEVPGMGAPRPEVRPGLRMHPVGRYLILYVHDDETLEIVRVLHAARRWEDLI